MSRFSAFISHGSSHHVYDPFLKELIIPLTQRSEGTLLIQLNPAYCFHYLLSPENLVMASWLLRPALPRLSSASSGHPGWWRTLTSLYCGQSRYMHSRTSSQSRKAYFRILLSLMYTPCDSGPAVVAYTRVWPPSSAAHACRAFISFIVR